MKNRKFYTYVSMLFLLLIFLVGCSNIEDSLSQKEAEQIVIDYNNNGNGSPKIISTKIKGNAYYIKWENKGNLEEGTDKVDKNGKVTMIDRKIE